jgi:hypothetical protein
VGSHGLEGLYLTHVVREDLSELLELAWYGLLSLSGGLMKMIPIL